jgi:hypothetical protein
MDYLLMDVSPHLSWVGYNLTLGRELPVGEWVVERYQLLVMKHFPGARGRYLGDGDKYARLSNRSEVVVNDP